ncbi:Pkinase domain-containing protein [Rhizoctonia solani AG-1 IA]|uniref:Pkinase domain-containing protein n=1 Tax=Thanatephorus cucumeris (strain AG1-IA) TaxID=983506 RepID=L8X057_THACA|nr:Pkinase domain-containing protein [Rhizoctonia solani AG-1 IA]
MHTNQSEEESRPGILSGFASSILNVIQPLVTGHQNVSQPYQHTPERGPTKAPTSGSSVIPGASSPAKGHGPSRSIPGRWNSVDFADVATINCDAADVRQTSVEVVDNLTATQNELDHSTSFWSTPSITQSGPGPSQYTLVHNGGDQLVDENYIAFPEPHIPQVEVTSESHFDSQEQLGLNFISPDFNSAPKRQSFPPSSPGRAAEDSGVANNKGFLANSPLQPDPVEIPLLKAPVVNNDNCSQDRLSVSSMGDASTHSQGKKGIKHFWDSTKSRLKSQPATPPKSRSESPKVPSGPPSKIRASVVFQKQEKKLDALDTKLEYFQNVELHSSTTWGDICNELMPLPAFGPIGKAACIPSLKSASNYHLSGQWQRLRGNCVVISRVLVHQYERYQTEPEKLKLLGKVCENLEIAIAEISMTARKWSEKNPVEAFVTYERMERALNDHFLALNDVLKMMVSTSQVLNETWSSEIAKSQKEERQQLEIIRALLQEQNSSLDQLTQAIQSKDDLITKLIGENEVTIGRDAEDTDKLIQMIVAITGVEPPTEVFQTEPCTNEANVDPIHGHSSTVYKATLARGQSVAKKVFYLNKYSEGDVKTYKMTRDAKQWRVFDSEYTLKCLGIGMEKSNDTQFKLYMLSPWMENMDAINYLKDRRQSIDQRNILRIVGPQSLLTFFTLQIANSGCRLGPGACRDPSEELGSLQYAPECHHFGPGRPDVTVANDVWGWAMTIITGAPPIRRIKGDMALPCATSEEFDATKQRHEYPEWEQYAYKPDSLWLLLSRCWNLDETKRPDMKTVSNEIEKIISQR